MLKKLLFLFIFMFLFSSASFAERIHLKNGKVLTGEVIEDGGYYKVIKVGNSPRKYFSEEIDYIEDEEDVVEEAVESEEVEVPLADLEIAADEFEDISEEKMQLILDLIEINGVRKNMQKNLDKSIKDVPWYRADEVKEILNVDDIITKFIPIYSNYYTEQELKEIVAFYKNGAGQKVIDVTPKIMEESMKTTIQYIQDRLKEIPQ